MNDPTLWLTALILVAGIAVLFWPNEVTSELRQQKRLKRAALAALDLGEYVFDGTYVFFDHDGVSYRIAPDPKGGFGIFEGRECKAVDTRDGWRDRRVDEAIERHLTRLQSALAASLGVRDG